jgi:hypothetical protein
MAVWIVECPNCSTPNEVPATAVNLECGKMYCTRTCENCGNEFSSEQPYWRWLELEHAPPPREKDGSSP